MNPLPAALSSAASADMRRAFDLCVAKTRRNIETLSGDPKSGAFAADGDYFAFDEGFFDIANWTSSFFTGMALLAFERTRDEAFLNQSHRLAGVYREKVTGHSMDTMHDLGFLYSLYSIELCRITGSAEHRSTALRAAEELAKRFSPLGGYIRAWGRMDDQSSDYAGLAIIDAMMNLPLLFWASRETGNPFFREIAIRHADTTASVFIRPDDSIFHAFRFEPEKGLPLRGDNYCGYGVDSYWARGATWAIYGFALAFRHTRLPRYLQTSQRLARKFISMLDAEVVPVWDFRLDSGRPPLRDSSAAAIAACGLLELASHAAEGAQYVATADALLTRLCSPAYLDERIDCRGVLKQGETGDGLLPGGQFYNAKSVYTSWGDYFFMEALGYRLHNLRRFW